MEYTDMEKQVLSLMERTDFKHLSKSDVISYASKLNELRPEVATQVLAQYPELAKLIQSSMVEYRDMLGKVLESDNESTSQVYAILNQELEGASESRKQYIEFADKVRSDLSKCLDQPNLTPEERKEILKQEMEIFRMVDSKDKEIREQEENAVHTAEKKDTEKKGFNWKLVCAASAVVITAVGIGASALGGNFDIKLPKKQ